MRLRSLRLWLVVAVLLVVGGLVCLVLGSPWWRGDPCDPAGEVCLLVYEAPARPGLLWTGAALVGFGMYGGVVVAVEAWLRGRRTVAA